MGPYLPPELEDRLIGMISIPWVLRFQSHYECLDFLRLIVSLNRKMDTLCSIYGREFLPMKCFDFI